MGQQVVLDYPMVSPMWLLHSWPHIVTLQATIATRLWAEMAENCWKQVFSDTYLHNFFFHTQISSLGRQVVFNYPMLSPKVSTTLVIPNSYPHLWAKMAKNGWKQVLDDTYLHNLLFYTQVWSMGQQRVFNYPMVSLKVSTTLLAPYSYPMGHHSHPFVTKNGWKWLKTGVWCYLPP